MIRWLRRRKKKVPAFAIAIARQIHREQWFQDVLTAGDALVQALARRQHLLDDEIADLVSAYRDARQEL